MTIYRTVFMFSLIILVLSCQQEKKTFEETAVDVIEEARRERQKNNQQTLRSNSLPEDIRDIVEWHDYHLHQSREKLHIINSVSQYENLANASPESVKALQFGGSNADLYSKDISIFSNLEYLFVGGEFCMPSGFYNLKNLRYLKAGNGLNCKLDERIVNLKKLEEIRFVFTNLELTPEISSLKNLKVIKGYNFNRSQPFQDIFRIPNLENLGLEFENEEQLSGISNLNRLKTLATNIVTKEVGELNLTGLYIKKNNEEKYPKELSKLNNLVVFYWGQNTVKESIPEFVSMLDNLEYVEIRGCSKLVNIPKSLDNLKNLKQFNIIGHPKFSGDISHLTTVGSKINIK